MKTIIFMISVIMFAIPTYAVDMCASDNAFAVILDPSVSPNSNSYNDPMTTWRATAPYGTVVGISACLAKQGSSSNRLWTDNKGVLKDNNNVEVLGGERNGIYCWCKLTHPVESLWWFTGNTDPSTNSGYWSQTSDCVAKCAYVCSYIFKNNYNYARSGLFRGIGEY